MSLTDDMLRTVAHLLRVLRDGDGPTRLSRGEGGHVRHLWDGERAARYRAPREVDG